MEMKDRVDNFLKVARTKLLDGEVNKYERSNLNDLMGSLLALLDDPEEKDRLDVEYNKILKEFDLTVWDERFLNVIAGEEEEVPVEDKLYDLTRQVTQGRSKQRMGQPLAPTPTLSGMSTNEVWANNDAILEKELQELKDEIRRDREGAKNALRS